MHVEHLTWDSEFFGFPVGRLHLEATGLDETNVLDVLRASRETVVYVCLPTASVRNHLALTRIGATMYDVRTVYRRVLNAPGVLPNPRLAHGIEVYNGPATRELEHLAIQSGQYSRFKRDPRFKPHFERLYRHWMQVSVDGTFADRVFVARAGRVISGVLTAKAEAGKGSIGLFAALHGFRGQGIGKQLLEACESWYVDYGVSVSQIVTQRDNTSACEWYSRRGYSVQSCQGVYHWWRLNAKSSSTRNQCGADTA